MTERIFTVYYSGEKLSVSTGLEITIRSSDTSKDIIRGVEELIPQLISKPYNIRISSNKFFRIVSIFIDSKLNEKPYVYASGSTSSTSYELDTLISDFKYESSSVYKKSDDKIYINI